MPLSKCGMRDSQISRFFKEQEVGGSIDLSFVPIGKI